MKTRSVLPLAIALCALAGVVFYIKAFTLGLPLQPDEESAVWVVEARASFVGKGKVKARWVLPNNPPGFEVLGEDFVVREFGMAEETVNGQRSALLSARRSNGPQAL